MRLSRTRIRWISLLSVVGMMLGMMVVSGGASSHREAPLIANDPQADNTDLYSWVDGDMLNIVAAYYPLEMPAGFPNGFTFGDQVLYTLRVDNTGDGIADVSWGFRFHTEIRNQGTFYSNVTLCEPVLEDLQITSPDDCDLNIVQTYDVYQANNSSLPVGSGKRIASGLYTSPNNVGPNSTPDFASTMAQAVYDLPGGGKVWAGQADDPFFADLGALWDLAQIRPDAAIDALADFNVQVIAVQVPISSVTDDGMLPTGPDDPDAAVGVWAANYRQRIQVLRGTISNPNAHLNENFESNQPLTAGAWTLVSRLGMPLSNEVILPLAEKDRWNRTEPKADAMFQTYYDNSHLAVLLNAIFGTPGATTGRADLSTIFLTGIPANPLGLPPTMVANDPEDAVPSDMLRINLALPSAFPNGRTLTDDIVDIELSVVGLSDGSFQGALDAVLAYVAGEGIGDGVDANDAEFSDTFPYVAVPHDGYSFDPDGEE